MTDPENRWLRTRDVVGDRYDAHYERLAAAGENVHGEADFVMRFSPTSVLDAGCGTGRVARELTVEEYDRITAAAGLRLIERSSTWEQALWILTASGLSR